MNLTIGKIIKDLRTKRGMSQEKLAEHLNIAPQSVSKWERGEAYPDITTLIPLAEFFDVSLDILMGRDQEKSEMKIQETLTRLDHFRHMGDHESGGQLAWEAYREFPFDVRIILRYVNSLFDTEDIQTNKNEIERLCRYIIQTCTEDLYRADAIVHLSELYSQCGNYRQAMDCVQMLPDMQACREFAACMIYPRDDERDFHAMATFIEGATERMLWLICCIAVDRTALTTADRIQILENACTMADAIYPDFDHGICYSSMLEIYLALFRLYSEEQQTIRAIEALTNAFRHAKASDDCNFSVVTHTSPLLRGHTFDMTTTWNGSKCNEVWWLLERLQNDECFRFPRYEDDPLYQKLLDSYRPFAVRDMTAEQA